LKGVINNGGPIHYTFQPDWLKDKPQGLKLALAKMLNKDVNQVIEEMKAFSLLHENAFHKKQHAPILNINGKNDAVVSIQEIEFLNEHQIQQDTLLFGIDRHVASRNWRLHEIFAAEWLAKKLKER
jgi:esterase FrsA